MIRAKGSNELLLSKESGCLRCRFGKNLGTQGEWTFHKKNLHIFSNFNRYLVSVDMHWVEKCL